MFEITTERLPIKVWADALEPEAEQQAKNLANLPFAVSHVAIMPDVHSGYGMPIGGVLATDGVIVPNAVGVDIGCGMSAVNTGIQIHTFLPVREKVLNDIQRSIPTGFEGYREPQNTPMNHIFDMAPDSPVIQKHLENARRQLGTLGGGNHFIELQKDPQGNVWVMIHSGSRNLGKQICDYYNRLARELNVFRLPEKWDLMGFPLDSREGREYYTAMEFALKFSFFNRAVMLEKVLEIISRHLEFSPEKSIDVHHNYAAIETHYGKKLIIHRKGAVRAVGTVIIPGSMGTPSYICEGLANPVSFASCSHGAGRRMSRGQAKREISVEAVVKEMREKNIAFFKANKRDAAEEASGAYKDIAEVLDNQKDLVKPLLKLVPVGVVKG